MIKVNTVERAVTYEIEDVSFYQIYGQAIAITKDFLLKASVDGGFSYLIPATNTLRYEEAVAECVNKGTEISIDDFEKAAQAVIENMQNKIAFIKEALALEGLGALAD
jgi:hypothetical protein